MILTQQRNPLSAGLDPMSAVGTEVATHCPYCALQCGMTLAADADGVRGPAPAVPHQRGRAVPEGLDRRRAARPPRTAHHPAGARRPRTPRCGRPPGTRRSTGSSPASARIQARHGRDAVAVFGGGGLTNEKAYTLGKFARVALRTRNIDYNGRFCMSSAAAAGIRAFGLDRGLPFPVADIGPSRHRAPGRGEHRGDDAAAGPAPDPAARRRRHAHRGRPPGDRDGRSGHAAPATDARHRPRGGQRAAAHRARRGLGRRGVRARRAPPGFDDVRRTVAQYWPSRVERLSGVPVADLESAARALARPARTARGAHDPHRPRRRAARQGRGHRHRVHQPGARPRACPAGPARGYGCITGQGNGQGGREHGQKADQLPGYRRIDDPAARAHVAGGLGRRPGRAARAGRVGVRAARRARHRRPARRRCSCSAPTRSSPPRGPAHIEGRLRSLDLLVVADFVLSETAAIADVVLPDRAVGRGGRHDDQPGGPGAAAAGAAATAGRRAHRPARSWPTLADRLGSGGAFSADPHAVFAELRRASAGGPADYSGITWERDRRRRRRVLAVPVRASGHAADVRRAVRHRRTAGPGSSPVEHRPAAEEICAGLPATT